MSGEEIMNYCLSKLGAYKTCPFGPVPICFKVGNRIFLEWYPEMDIKPNDADDKIHSPKLTLRCEPMLADYYRRNYPGIVVAGYHCPDRQKMYKNTIYLNNGISDGLILDMIDHSYEEAVKRLNKTEKSKLNCINNNNGNSNNSNNQQ